MAFAVAKPAYLGCYVLPGAVAPGLGNLHSRYKPATFGPNSWREPESTPEAPGALDRDSSLVRLRDSKKIANHLFLHD